MTSTQVVQQWVTTNSSPSQDHTVLDDQPSTNTTPYVQYTLNVWAINIILKMTSTWITFKRWDRNNVNSPSQNYTNPDDQPTKHWLNWVTTNNSHSQDYTNPDDQPTINTTLCYKDERYDWPNMHSKDDFNTGCRKVTQNQCHQSFPGLCQHGRSTK